MNQRPAILSAILILALFVGVWPALAQEATPTPTTPAQPAGVPAETPPPEEPPIPRTHIVQEGETLISIALLYDLTLEALLAANNLDAEALIFPGDSLIIPAGAGDTVTTLYPIQVGDTLQGLAAAFNTTADAIAARNRLLRPDRLIAGQTLSIVSRTGSTEPQTLIGEPYVIQPGETLLEVAARANLSPTELAALNNLPYGALLYPGQRLRLPGEEPYQSLPGEWAAIRLRPLPAIQGGTLSLYVENLLPGQPAGHFAGLPLRFAPQGDGYVALIGIDAFTEPGPYPLLLEGSSGERPWQPFRQELLVQSANYGVQAITIPNELSDLLDPQLRAEEDAYLATFYGRFSEDRQWEGIFQAPITTTIVSAGYGAARSYNGGEISIYHTGIDYAVPTGTPVLAPAAGTVIFSDVTDLRGSVIIIDHGWGVMTGYYHLVNRLVEAGQMVTAGQPIGEVGSTGLSSGPHLHWDVRIHNVPVDGEVWLRETFP